MGVSVVIPVYNEGPKVSGLLDRLFAVLPSDSEVVTVYDFPEDTTVAPLRDYATRESRLRPTLNALGRGPARAIRTGFDAARFPVTVVTMADSSDDITQIPQLVRLVEDGAVIAAASRYCRGGRQVGGPRLKGLLSRTAGLSLYYLARVGTRDATSSFKAYRTGFVRAAGVTSDAGFEIAIELVAKARRARLRVTEIPTVWQDRVEGTSNFKVAKWLPKYLRWYFHAFGPRRPIPGYPS